MNVLLKPLYFSLVGLLLTQSLYAEEGLVLTQAQRASEAYKGLNWVYSLDESTGYNTVNISKFGVVPFATATGMASAAAVSMYKAKKISALIDANDTLLGKMDYAIKDAADGGIDGGASKVKELEGRINYKSDLIRSENLRVQSDHYNGKNPSKYSLELLDLQQEWRNDKSRLYNEKNDTPEQKHWLKKYAEREELRKNRSILDMKNYDHQNTARFFQKFTIGVLVFGGINIAGSVFSEDGENLISIAIQMIVDTINVSESGDSTVGASYIENQDKFLEFLQLPKGEAEEFIKQSPSLQKALIILGTLLPNRLSMKYCSRLNPETYKATLRDLLTPSLLYSFSDENFSEKAIELEERVEQKCYEIASEVEVDLVQLGVEISHTTITKEASDQVSEEISIKPSGATAVR